jgi:Ca-activated chloride channel family protein
VKAGWGLAVLFLALPPCRAQEAGEELGIVIHDRVQVELQQVYVTVTDRGGQRPLGLGAEAFELFEEGVRQRLITVEGGDLPLTAVLLVDGSASMRGAKLEAALDGVDAFAAGMRELDEAQLVVFADSVLQVRELQGGPGAPRPDLAGTEAMGGTRLFDHLYLALLSLEERQGRRVVVLLSDGLDGHSALRAEALAAVARRTRAQVYWVRLEGESPGARAVSAWLPEREIRGDAKALGRLCRASGGRTLGVESEEEIVAAFGELLAELREQYALGYYPEPTGPPGTFRRIEVRVVSEGLKARAAEGYITAGGGSSGGW